MSLLFSNCSRFRPLPPPLSPLLVSSSPYASCGCLALSREVAASSLVGLWARLASFAQPLKNGERLGRVYRVSFLRVSSAALHSSLFKSAVISNPIPHPPRTRKVSTKVPPEPRNQYSNFWGSAICANFLQRRVKSSYCPQSKRLLCLLRDDLLVVLEKVPLSLSNLCIQRNLSTCVQQINPFSGSIVVFR